MGVKIGKYTYEKSDKKGKKLKVIVGNRTIHFGNSDYQHFHDKTGIWKSLDHGDKDRRKNYLKRASGITNKNGELTKDKPTCANYHAIRILW